MAKFQINSQVPIEEICLDSTSKPGGGQRRITLQLAGWAGGRPPGLTGGGHFARLVNASHNARSHLTTFTIEAVNGAKGTTYFYDSLSPDGQGAMLRVIVGPVTNHAGFQNDLIAELLGRSEDPVKLWVYQRILAAKNNNDTAVPWADWDRLLADQPLKQITDPHHPGKWNCGAALNNFGASYFGTNHYRFTSAHYYKKFKSTNPHEPNRVSDIQFDDDLVSRGAEKIRQLLEKRIAVTVFVAHNDGFQVQGGVIQQTGDTHFVTIVGCDAAAKMFLFTDPWPGGSRLLYTSGILGNVESAFMGLLEFTQRGGNIISTSASAQRGKHRYVLLTGPS